MNRALLDTKRFLSWSIHWAPTFALWGVTGTLGLIYAVQPKPLFKHLPLIGHNYRTQKEIDEQALKEKQARIAARNA
eukprot:gene3843-4787_t